MGQVCENLQSTVMKKAKNVGDRIWNQRQLCIKCTKANMKVNIYY